MTINSDTTRSLQKPSPCGPTKWCDWPHVSKMTRHRCKANCDVTIVTYDDAHIAEDSDPDDDVFVTVVPSMRTLHPVGEKDGVHAAMLRASDSIESYYTLESSCIKDTFGICKCLRGAEFPFADTRPYFNRWTDNIISSDFHVITEDFPKMDADKTTCPFCKRRKRNTNPGSPTQRPRFRRTAYKPPDSQESSYRYQTDTSEYIKAYRRQHSISHKRTTQCTPVLGKDVPDPYLPRIRSYNDVMSKLECVAAQRTYYADRSLQKLTRSPSAPSLPDKAAQSPRTGSGGNINKLETINLAPLPTRHKETLNLTTPQPRNTNTHMVKPDQSEDGNVTRLDRINPVKRDDLKNNTSMVVDDQMTSGVYIGQDVTNQRANGYKETHSGSDLITREAATNNTSSGSHLVHCHANNKHTSDAIKTLNNNNLSKKLHSNKSSKKCKTFTSSNQYLDLSSRTSTSLPLPVHVILDANNIHHSKPKAKQVVRLPRCHSASSSSCKSTRHSYLASTSSGATSNLSGGATSSLSGGATTYSRKTLRRSSTVNDMTSLSQGCSSRNTVYMDPVSMIKALTVKAGQLL